MNKVAATATVAGTTPDDDTVPTFAQPVYTGQAAALADPVLRQAVRTLTAAADTSGLPVADIVKVINAASASHPSWCAGGPLVNCGDHASPAIRIGDGRLAVCATLADGFSGGTGRVVSLEAFDPPASDEKPLYAGVDLAPAAARDLARDLDGLRTGTEVTGDAARGSVSFTRTSRSGAVVSVTDWDREHTVTTTVTDRELESLVGALVATAALVETE